MKKGFLDLFGYIPPEEVKRIEAEAETRQKIVEALQAKNRATLQSENGATR